MLNKFFNKGLFLESDGSVLAFDFSPLLGDQGNRQTDVLGSIIARTK
jgi:hypothetical protein